jgi:hypothetical protein
MLNSVEHFLEDLEIKELKKLSKDFIENSPIGMILLDESFNVILKNNLIDKYFMNKITSSSKLIGSVFNCENLLNSEDICGCKRQCRKCMLRNTLQSVFDHNKTLKNIRINKNITLNNKKYTKWLDLTISPILMGSKTFLGVSILDLTEFMNYKIEFEMSKILSS